MLQRLIGLVSEVDTRCASAESERGFGVVCSFYAEKL